MVSVPCERVYMKLCRHNRWYGVLFLLLPFVQSSAKENLIVNGDFTDSSGWNDLGQYNQGQATGTIDNGTYVIAISEPGTEVWSIQFTQPGISLDSGTAYTFSCSVAATIERTIELSLSQDGGAYASYSGRDTLSISPQIYNFEKTFVMTQPTDTNVRLEFNCGKAGGTISISEVRLIEFTGKVLSMKNALSGEVIYSGIPYTLEWSSINITGSLTVELSEDNGSTWKKVGEAPADSGTFTWVPAAEYSPWCLIRLKSVDGGEIFGESDGVFELAPSMDLVKNGNFTDETFWNLGLYGGLASDTITDDSRYHIIIDSAASEPWQIQLTQNGIPLVNGQQYRLTFTAAAGAVTEIEVNIGMDHEPFTLYSDSAMQTISLSTEQKRFSIDFVMDAPSDSTARVAFNCGQAAGELYLDNIHLVEKYIASAKTLPKRIVRQRPAGYSLRIVTGNGHHGKTGASDMRLRTGYGVLDLLGRRSGPAGIASSRADARQKTIPRAPGVYIIREDNSKTP